MQNKEENDQDAKTNHSNSPDRLTQRLENIEKDFLMPK